MMELRNELTPPVHEPEHTPGNPGAPGGPGGPAGS